jgi:hypothetical protein
MTKPKKDESHDAKKETPKLELNKETLRDLDVERTDANEVKGGGMGTLVGTSRTCR